MTGMSSWFGDSLSSLKGQISNLTQEVLSTARAEAENFESPTDLIGAEQRIRELEQLCEEQRCNILHLQQETKVLEEVRSHDAQLQGRCQELGKSLLQTTKELSSLHAFGGKDAVEKTKNLECNMKTLQDKLIILVEDFETESGMLREEMQTARQRIGTQAHLTENKLLQDRNRIVNQMVQTASQNHCVSENVQQLESRSDGLAMEINALVGKEVNFHGNYDENKLHDEWNEINIEHQDGVDDYIRQRELWSAQQKEIEKLRQRECELTHKLASLEINNKTLKEQLLEWEKEKEQELSLMEEETKALKEQMFDKEKEKKVTELEEQNRHLQEVATNLEQQVLHKDREAVEMLAVLEEENLKLKQQMAEREFEFEEGKFKEDASNERIRALEEEVTKNGVRKNQLEEDFYNRENESRKVKDALEEKLRSLIEEMKEKEDIEKDYEMLTKQLEAFEGEKNVLAERLEECEEKSRLLLKQIEGNNRNCEDMKKELDLEKEVTKTLNQTVDNIQKEKANLEEKIRVLQEQVVAKESIEEPVIHSEKLHELLDAKEQQEKALNDRISELECTLVALREEANEIKAKANEKEQKLESLEEIVDNLADERIALEELMAEKNAKVSELEKIVARLTEDKTNLESNNDARTEHSEEIADLKALVNNLKEEKKGIEEEINIKSEAIHVLTRRLEEKENEFQKEMEALEQAKVEALAKSKEMVQLQLVEANRNLEDRICVAEEENRVLHDKTDKLMNDHERCKLLNEQLQQENANLTRENHIFLQESEKKESDLLELKQLKAEYSDFQKKASEQITLETERLNEEMRQRSESLSSRINELEDENKRLQGMLENREAQLLEKEENKLAEIAVWEDTLRTERVAFDNKEREFHKKVACLETENVTMKGQLEIEKSKAEKVPNLEAFITALNKKIEEKNILHNFTRKVSEDLNASLKERVIELKDESEKKDEEITSLQSRIQSLEADNKELVSVKEENAALEERLKVVQRESELQISALRIENNALKNKETDNSDILNAIEEENKLLKEHMRNWSQLKEQNDSFKQIVGVCQAFAVKLLSELFLLNQEIEGMMQENGGCNCMNTAIRSQMGQRNIFEVNLNKNILFGVETDLSVKSQEEVLDFLSCVRNLLELLKFEISESHTRQETVVGYLSSNVPDVCDETDPSALDGSVKALVTAYKELLWKADNVESEYSILSEEIQELREERDILKLELENCKNPKDDSLSWPRDMVLETITEEEEFASADSTKREKDQINLQKAQGEGSKENSPGISEKDVDTIIASVVEMMVTDSESATASLGQLNREEIVSVLKDTTEKLKEIQQSKLQELTSQHHNVLEQNSSLIKRIEVLEAEKQQLIYSLQQKHDESLLYHRELQKLQGMQDQLNGSITREEQLKQELNRALERDSSVRAELNTASSNQGHLRGELSRLREHLLEMEDAHTKETLEAEHREEGLRRQIGRLKEDLAQWETEALAVRPSREVAAEDEASVQLAKLQLVLQAFQTQREQEVSWLKKQQDSKIEKMQAEARTLRQQITDMQKQLSSAHEEVSRAARAYAQLESKDNYIAGMQRAMNDKEKFVKELEKKLEDLSSDKATKIDRELLRSLVVHYFSSNISSHQKADILRVMAKVLELNEEDRSKLGLGAKEEGNRWIPHWLRPVQTPSVEDDTSLSNAFVEFLQQESRPRRAISLSLPEDTTPDYRSQSPRIPGLVQVHEDGKSSPQLPTTMQLPSFSSPQHLHKLLHDPNNPPAT